MKPYCLLTVKRIHPDLRCQFSPRLFTIETPGDKKTCLSAFSEKTQRFNQHTHSNRAVLGFFSGGFFVTTTDPPELVTFSPLTLPE